MRRLMQLALDFFDLPAIVDPPHAIVAEKKQPKLPLPLDGKAPCAPKIRANKAWHPSPAEPLLSSLEFRHPKAHREVLLGEAVVGYALQRARRRTIGFTVSADGLSVRAPAWATLAAIDAALCEKSSWIVRKLHDARQRQQRLESGRIAWRDGAVLPYLGEPLAVVLDPLYSGRGPGGTLVQSQEPDGTANTVMRQLHIGLLHHATPEQIRDATLAWLMRDAQRYFTERLDHFAPRLNVRWTHLRLSSAQTLWGSAKTDGSIRLNWRLMHYRPAVIDYVVAHELAHLRVMNHSPRFWSTVAQVVPDYAALRHRLRNEPAPLW